MGEGMWEGRGEGITEGEKEGTVEGRGVGTPDGRAVGAVGEGVGNTDKGGLVQGYETCVHLESQF